MERPSWNDYFKEIVLATSKRSPCERLHVGCLLVKENRIISQGYNGFLSGLPHKSIVINDHEVSTIHAEQNAIVDCAKRGVSCDGCDAYVTHHPCLQCAKLLHACGVKHIYYLNDYKNDDTIRMIGINIPIEKI